MAATKKASTPKKTTAKKSNKAPAKKPTKTTVSKKAVKKAASAKKTAAPKTKKATPAKKTTKSTTSTTKTKKAQKQAPALSTAKKSTSSTASSKKSPTEVAIPSNASVRMIEKAGVLQVEFDRHFRKAFHTVAYVSGVCFILVGSTVAAASYVSSDSFFKQSAQVIAGTERTTSNEETSVIYNQSMPEPEVSILTDIPEEPTEAFSFMYQARGVASHRIEIQELKTGEILEPLRPETLSESRYRATLPIDEYTPGVYRITLYIDHTNSERQVFTDTFFVAPEKESQDTRDQNTPPTTNPATSTRAQQEITADMESVAFESATEPVEEPVAEEESIENTELPLTQNRLLEISVQNTTLSEIVTIEIFAPADFTNIQLYARPVRSLDSIFLSTAVLQGPNQVFVFDSQTLLPNGQYELFAQAQTNDIRSISNPLIVDVQNESSVPLIARTEDLAAPKRSTSTTQESSPQEQSERQFIASPQGQEYLSEDMHSPTQEVLRENQAELTGLLQRYAVAVQSENELLREAANTEFDDLVTRLTLSLREGTSPEISTADFSQQLRDEISIQKQSVERFEEIRRSRSDNRTATDSDHDGISDFDELNLYQTDPASADSDADGVHDGIEIIGGFDPLDASYEAEIQFSSPQTSVAPVRPDVLMVESVVPVHNLRIGPPNEVVAAQITGRGLPNSFVTLYIFSEPTIVTVKTDSDGSFVYTFDKELSDGNHEVYVAVTDNTGEIIAQSNPFSFIKTAQAFTPVGASAADVLTQPVANENAGYSYGLVAGMGLLALGLIIFMLGMSVKGKKEDEQLEVQPMPS